MEQTKQPTAEECYEEAYIIWKNSHQGEISQEDMRRIQYSLAAARNTYPEESRDVDFWNRIGVGRTRTSARTDTFHNPDFWDWVFGIVGLVFRWNAET